MELYKLKVYIGGHTFEAEGDKEAVERQFAAFGEMLKITAMAASGGQPLAAITPQYGLSKIARVDDKIVFLTTLPQTESQSGDTLLILLLGHKVLLGKDAAGGTELLAGLKRSGITLQRIDRGFGKYLGGTQALVVKSGLRRGVRYRLTEKGLQRAQQLSEQTAGVVHFSAKV